MTTTDLLTIAIEGVNNAVDNLLTCANDEGIRNVYRAAANGTLAIEVDVNSDGTVWGRYVDASRLPCWDDCDGILTFHRAGWCRHNPEHADFDCNCDGGHDEPPLDSEEEARLYGDYLPDLDDGLGVVIDPEDEEMAWWLIDGVWDGPDDYEPEFGLDEGFDEDYAITQAENRYERWLGRS